MGARVSCLSKLLLITVAREYCCTQRLSLFTIRKCTVEKIIIKDHQKSVLLYTKMPKETEKTRLFVTFIFIDGISIAGWAAPPGNACDCNFQGRD